MSLAPTFLEKLARARADLRMGLPVVLGHGLVASAETLCTKRLNAFDADAYLAITARRAQTLKARAYDGDVARIRLPRPVTADWVRALADPADDLRHPMKGPLHSLRGGDADLSRTAIQLLKSARLLPAALVTPLTDPEDFAQAQDLTQLPLAPMPSSPLHPVVSARLPLEVSQIGRLHVFRPEDGGEEHYAVEIGRPDRNTPVLCRLHSACFTGDLMGSLKCDCGAQLRGALALMGGAGEGVLLYLNQEGRGIGLANKMRAYSLQDVGFDTVEANHRLGFEDDERDFRLGAQVLTALGFSAVRLMTNNPAKMEMLRSCGIDVTERVPLAVGRHAENTSYLDTKAAKSGHLL